MYTRASNTILAQKNEANVFIKCFVMHFPSMFLVSRSILANKHPTGIQTLTELNVTFSRSKCQIAEIAEKKNKKRVNHLSCRTFDWV